jgi:molybdenum cofactor cytidylyltransferase
MGTNKLLAEVGGQTVLARVLSAVLVSGARPVIVVTGHEAQAVREEIDRARGGASVDFVHHAGFAQGLGTSLATGIAALGGGVDGALIVLADMPGLRPEHLQRLIAAFVTGEARDICVPVSRGVRGNPVLWPARCFAALSALTGDRGGRDMLDEQASSVLEVEMPDDAVLRDVDTPADLDDARVRR